DLHAIVNRLRPRQSPTRFVEYLDLVLPNLHPAIGTIGKVEGDLYFHPAIFGEFWRASGRTKFFRCPPFPQVGGDHFAVL
ncbi:MAG: hypothetical protein RLZZ162_227, partial [Verrucomicrobiota bacterium]